MSPSLGDLAVALATAQAELRDPPRNKKGQVRGRNNYRYAGLDDLLQTVRPVLSKHGLAVVQTVERDDRGVALCTRLLHSGGAEVTSRYPLEWNGGPQDHGSEITYARRYSLEAIIGVAATDDDDGSAAQGAPSALPADPDATERAALIERIRACVHVLPEGRLDAMKRGERVTDPRTAPIANLRALARRVEDLATDIAGVETPADLGGE